MSSINGTGGGLRLERNNARLLQLEKKWEDEDFINMTNSKRNINSLELDLESG